MRSLLFLLFSVLFLGNSLTAQTQRIDRLSKTPIGWAFPDVATPTMKWTVFGEEHNQPFAAVAIKTIGVHPTDLTLLLWDVNDHALPPIQIGTDPHTFDESAEQLVSNLIFVPAEAVLYQIVGGTSAPIWDAQVDVHWYFPDFSTSTSPTFSITDRAGCPCQQPGHTIREQWCPAGNCPPNPSPSMTNPTHLIVHHSAGSNTSNDWAAVVRSIWNYHVGTNGWSDIGYNYLIAPTGEIFEGRGNNVTGAHFCGTNGSTMGICMIGTYTTVAPTSASMTSLKEMFAWKACDRNIDPEAFSFHSGSGLNLFTVSGHRDGCSTECPGEMTYQMLPQLRMDIADYIANECSAAPLNSLQLLNVNLVGTSKSIQIEWQDTNASVEGYLLERSVNSGGNFLPYKNLNAGSTSYLDTDTDFNTGYYYQVAAYKNGDTTAWSNALAVVTPMMTSETSSVNEVPLVRIGKNPFGESLPLQVLEKGNLQITDMKGQSVFQNSYKSATFLELDTQNWASGQYVLYFRSENAYQVLQLIKI